MFKAKAMPIVFWQTEEYAEISGHSAEVLLPNGCPVVVEHIHYQGFNAGAHHWQAAISENGKPSERAGFADMALKRTEVA